MSNEILQPRRVNATWVQRIPNTDKVNIETSEGDSFDDCEYEHGYIENFILATNAAGEDLYIWFYTSDILD